MTKHFLLLILASVLLQVHSEDVAPRDLVDQAKQQLDNLRAIVFGNIQAAQDTFAHYYSDMFAYSHNVVSLGDMSIAQEYTTVISEVDQIKDLAHAANKDISSCTDNRVPLIGTLKGDFTNKLEQCVYDKNLQTTNILDASFYIVDATMTKVHNLELQLMRCGESLLCISPILTEIELDMITLPQNIKLQVSQTGESLNTLKLLIGSCRDNNVSAFTAEATGLLAEIVQCANEILEN